jgi:hypothetical protein
MTATLRACDLRTDTVYVSPRGLLVRLLPNEARDAGAAREVFHFAYVGSLRGKRSDPDGFSLTAGNLHILRKGASL